MKKENRSEFRIKVLFYTIICILLLSILFVCIFKISRKENKIVSCDINASANDNYVFLGDSITDFYAIDELYDNLPVINSGKSGYTTEDILNNLSQMVSIYNPTKVIILIGTNDLNKGSSNEEIIDNIKKIVIQILKERPKARIYIQSIYPINNTDNEKINHSMVGNRTNKRIKQINKELKKYCKKKKYTYIDMYKELIDQDGNLDIKYTTEGLHISDTGYLKITRIMYKVLNDEN